MGVVASFIYGRPLPNSGRHLYMADHHNTQDKLEFLCCPEVSGCNIRLFDEGNHRGGDLKYTVRRSVSYSPSVPRFVVEVREKGIPRPAVVGRMEKLDTILRAKSGEFLSIQLWKIVCSGLQWTDRRKRRVMPSDSDAFVMHVAIANQAKIDFMDDTDDIVLALETERWSQCLSTDNPSITVNKTTSKTAARLNTIKVNSNNQKVCTAKQQNFDLFEDDIRPYLGIQLEKSVVDDDDSDSEDMVATHSLNSDSVALVMLCLAWSSGTMPLSSPVSNFVLIA